MAGEQMRRTLRELVFLNTLNLPPMGITIPEKARTWELNASFIQILLKFHGIPGEDPQRHLQDFEMVCLTQPTEGNLEQYIRFLSFSFTLQDGAREWLYTIFTGSVTTWSQLQHKFLEKYFPIARVQAIRRKIGSIKMGANESFYDYWECFQMQLMKCLQHQIPDYDFIQFFTTGLRVHERVLVNISCGGSILNKFPKDAFRLFSDMAKDSREDGDEGIQQASELGKYSAAEAIIEKFCERIQQTISDVGTAKEPRFYENYKSTTCFTNECPTMQENIEEVNDIWGQNNYQMHLKPSSQAFNPCWRDEESCSYN